MLVIRDWTVVKNYVKNIISQAKLLREKKDLIGTCYASSESTFD